MASPEKHETHCPNPQCADIVASHGEPYHRVYPSHDKDYVARCEQCGGRLTHDGKWVYICVTCNKEVDELFGLFVPHNCKECQQNLLDEQRRSGNICGMCRQPRALCCC